MKIEISNKGEDYLYSSTEDISWKEVLKIVRGWIKDIQLNDTGG